MKILVISNFYPPHFIGGYELGCRDIADGLQARGHEVDVLTSTHGIGHSVDEGRIHRWLLARLAPPAGRILQWLGTLNSEVKNQAAVRRAVRFFQPDVIYVWNVWYSSLSLALEAERAGIPVSYYISDLWPTRWMADFGVHTLNAPRRSVGGIVQSVVRVAIRACGAQIPSSQPGLRFCQFTSDFIRQKVLAAGYTPERSWVIPWSVDLVRFKSGTIRWPITRVLYVGQLIEHKGVHTALEAFVRVARTDLGSSLTFTIAGRAVFTPAYEQRLRRIAEDAGISHRVILVGQVPREDLPQLYADHDVLLFPSEWDEPFSISLVEAMAAGLAVITTRTGGTPEIARPEDNSLDFIAGCVDQCAAQLTRLLSNERLYKGLRRRARETAVTGFGFSQMLDHVEKSLAETVAGGRAKQS